MWLLPDMLGLVAAWGQGTWWSFGLVLGPFPLFSGPGPQGTGYLGAVGDDVTLDMEDGHGMSP